MRSEFASFIDTTPLAKPLAKLLTHALCSAGSVWVSSWHYQAWKWKHIKYINTMAYRIEIEILFPAKSVNRQSPLKNKNSPDTLSVCVYVCVCVWIYSVCVCVCVCVCENTRKGHTGAHLPKPGHKGRSRRNAWCIQWFTHELYAPDICGFSRFCSLTSHLDLLLVYVAWATSACGLKLLVYEALSY